MPSPLLTISAPSIASAIPWYAFAFVLAFLVALLVGWSLCRAAAIGDEQVRRAFAEWDAEEVDEVWRERSAS